MKGVETPKSKSRAHRQLGAKRPPVTQEINSESSERKSRKRIRVSKRESTSKEGAPVVWPEYFHSLYKIFKALNTVLAFVSARKHLATTFPVIRSSVEGLLKEPLELQKVAELKALLPDLIKFAYIPRNEHRIHGDSDAPRSTSGHRKGSPEFTIPLGSTTDNEEHVLVLELAENSKGKRSENSGSSYGATTSLSPKAVKALIEKRNERCAQAFNELILATANTDDPVTLLQAAGRDHVPLNPSTTQSPSNRFTELKSIAHMPVPGPQDRQTIDAVLAELCQQEWYKEQIASRRAFEAKEGQIAALEPSLSSNITRALKDSRNIDSLYSHQVAAISAIARGRNVIVSTSTASGKSVIYQVPVLAFLEGDPDATAMFIYPTKALAQDQKGVLEQLLFCCPGLQNINVATYDGDTPQEHREGIRETASVVFTNFDMIHVSILPHEDVWRRFLENLKLVVVDELHYYSGIFGSHVAQIMRRFRRVCAAVGNRRTRFVSCSATISNPLQHMKNIFGVDEIEVVTQDGAPSGRKEFVVWNPPPIDPLVPALGRHSALSEATGIMRFLMKRGVRVILFCKYRKMCELAMKTIRLDLTAEGRLDILDRVKSYRGGYSRADRRRIEHDAFSGSLLGIIATNALELGVDIGVLDAVIMLGFPISLASFRQQSGRAGRRSRDSLSVLVVEFLPIDQHYLNNPDELFDRSTEDLIIDLDSKVILAAHLQCAGQEMPLSLQDERYFGPLLQELCETQLIKDKDGWYHTNPKFLPFPSRHFSIRGSDEEKYVAVDVTRAVESGSGPRILEEIDLSRALFEIYEGAVFIHQGITFIVKEVSHDSRIAKLIQADVNWITKPRDFTNIDALQTYRIREIRGSNQLAYYGRVMIYTKVFGFFKMRNRATLDVVDLDTPPWERDTTGMWIDIPKSILEFMQSKGINAAGAIHAAEHAFLNRFAMASDLRTECKAPEKEFKITESRRKRPARLIFYDSAGHSGGVAAKAFDHTRDILQDACDATEVCQCENGCEKCIHSPSCKEGNQVSTKLGARIVLRGVLGLDIDFDSIPAQECELDWSTVEEATSVRVVGTVPVETDG